MDGEVSRRMMRRREGQENTRLLLKLLEVHKDGSRRKDQRAG